MLSIVVCTAVVLGFWFLMDQVARDRTSSPVQERPRRRRVRALLPRRGRTERRAAPAPTDPFVVLELQMRLSALASEIQRLERERDVIAVAHHLRASQYAYDALLSEACRLAGLEDAEPAPPPTGEDPGRPGEIPAPWMVDEDERMRQELELGARGWSW